MPSAMEKPSHGFTLEQVGSYYAISRAFADLLNDDQNENPSHQSLGPGTLVQIVGVVADGTIAIIEDAHGCRMQVSAVTDFYHS